MVIVDSYASDLGDTEMPSPAAGSGASKAPTTLTRDSQRRSLVSPQTSLGYTQMQIFLHLLTSTLLAEIARSFHDRHERPDEGTIYIMLL